ncbi:Uncharacterized protein Adt_02532 [Abeliophyllum distichum]|uniref:Uncharacterized protein n=1 Tax=Abeliophyllum distichum TaxID=126358 RepID=A0ABD1VVY2_9LAMI
MELLMQYLSASIWKLGFGYWRKNGEIYPQVYPPLTWQADPPLTWQAPRQRSSPRQRPFCVKHINTKWFTSDKTKKIEPGENPRLPDNLPGENPRRQENLPRENPRRQENLPVGLHNRAQIIGSVLGRADHRICDLRSVQLSADLAGLRDHAQIIGSALGRVDHRICATERRSEPNDRISLGICFFFFG